MKYIFIPKIPSITMKMEKKNINSTMTFFIFSIGSCSLLFFLGFLVMLVKLDLVYFLYPIILVAIFFFNIIIYVTLFLFIYYKTLKIVSLINSCKRNVTAINIINQVIKNKWKFWWVYEFAYVLIYICTYLIIYIAPTLHFAVCISWVSLNYKVLHFF